MDKIKMMLNSPWNNNVVQKENYFKILQDVGLKYAIRFYLDILIISFFNCLLFPPLRNLFLKIGGAQIGCYTIMMAVRLMNGDNSFIGGVPAKLMRQL